MKKFLAILAAVVGFVLIVPTFIDWGYFKEPLAQLVKTNTGYDVEIKGAVRLGFLPSPNLDAEDITFKIKGEKPVLLNLKGVSLKLRVLPLLQGKIEGSKVAIQKINYDEYHLSHCKISFDLQGDDLHIPSFQAEGYEGRLEGDAVLEKKGSTKLNLKIDNADIATLPKIKTTPLKKAILNATLSLTGSTFQSLGGTAHFNLTQGLVEIFDVRKFISDIKQVKDLEGVQTIVGDFGRKGEVSFDHLRANFTIQNGKALTQDMELLAEGVMINGKGTIDLPHFFLDMQTHIKVKELEQLPPLRLSVRGKFDSPTYGIDHEQLVQVFLKTEIGQRVVGEVIKEVSGKIQDILKSF